MKQNSIKIMLLLLAMLCAEAIFAQKSKSNSTAKKKKPDNTTKTVQVFGEENEIFEKDAGQVLAWNVLKLEPLALLIGDFPLIYERMLNQHFAIEAELGPTLKPGYAWNLSDILFDETFDGESNVFTPSLGYLAGLNFKFYTATRDNAPEGFFLALGTRIKQYNSYTFGFDQFGSRRFSGNEKFKTPLQVIDFVRITVGNGTTYDKFFAGYYLGFSLRQRTRTTDAGVFDGSTGTIQTILTEEKKLVPSFMLGVRVGFVF